MRSPPAPFHVCFLSLCLLINLAAKDKTKGSFTQCIKELSLLFGIQKASFGPCIVLLLIAKCCSEELRSVCKWNEKLLS